MAAEAAAQERARSQTEPRASLALRGLSKRFGGTLALDDVDLAVYPGEVHGLLGENGSGKSTLIKVLAGFHEPDAGRFWRDGVQVRLPLRPGQFRELGMAFVHQDLGLVGSLTVVENLQIAKIASPTRKWLISWARERRKARDIFDRYSVDLDPAATVADLPAVDRAQLAIVRALEGIAIRTDDHTARTGVLVLDEPTVFLPKTDVDRLFALVREVARSGSSVLFVSHDLDEVCEVTDRITVLRDGKVSGEAETRETAKNTLVEMILGRKLESWRATSPATGGESVLEVTGLTTELLGDVSLVARRGEVVGLTGLAGSGFEDVPYHLFGAERPSAGKMHLIESAPIDLTRFTPAAAVRSRIALIPGDRQRLGSIDSLPVLDNVMLQVLDDYFRLPGLRKRALMHECRRLIHEFQVRPDDPLRLYSSLSGGNQQKALLAKWLQIRPALLLLHEPTQGVDIGARQNIFGVIIRIAESGTAVICASADHEQLASICERVLVFQRGRIVHELTGTAVTKERITELCYEDLTDSTQTHRVEA